MAPQSPSTEKSVPVGSCSQAGPLIQAGEPPSLKSGYSPRAASELGPRVDESQCASPLRGGLVGCSWSCGPQDVSPMEF